MAFHLTPVTGDRLVGRSEEIDRLVGDLSDKKSRIGVSLTGARRVGKTSLLMEAKARLEAKGVVVAYASARRAPVDRLDEFMRYLLGQILDSFKDRIGLKTKAANLLSMQGGALADFLKSARITAEIGESIAYAASFARGAESDASRAVSDVFMLPDRLAAQCRRRCVLIIDEFPALAGLKTDGKKAVGGSIIGAIGTFNEEYGRTVLAVSGPVPSAARGAAPPHSAPLYRQLSSMEVGPFGRDGVAEFASAYLGRAAGGGGGGGGAAHGGIDRLLAVSGGLPYNLQVIGREIEGEIGRIGRRTLDARLVDGAVDGVIAKEGRTHFEAYLSAMQPAEVRIARIMAEQGAGPCRPRDIVASPSGGARLGMNKATALLSGMLDRGFVRRVGTGRYSLVDPLFGTWLARE